MILSGMTPFLSFKAWPTNGSRLPRLQAHRGYCGLGAVENTIAAFAAARAKGALMSECDVHLAADEVPVVFHDLDLLRIHNRPEKVQELSSVELKKLGVPTLAEVLVHPDVTPNFNIEIKNFSLLGTPLERKICEVVEETQSTQKVIFSSFNPFSLFLLEKHLPDVPRCFLWSKKSSKEHLIKPEWMLGLTSVHGLNLCYEDVSLDQINQLQKRNIVVSLWTVNSHDKINWFLNNGVDSIITDILTDSGEL